MRRLAMCALALAACGDGSEPVGIVGTWALEISDLCAFAATFTDDGRYRSGTVCELQTGGYGAEVWEGTYELDGATLRLTAARSSCEGTQTTTTSRWARNGDQLTVSPRCSPPMSACISEVGHFSTLLSAATVSASGNAPRFQLFTDCLVKPMASATAPWVMPSDW